MSLKLKEPSPQAKRVDLKAAVKEIADAADGKWRLVWTYAKKPSAYAASKALRRRGCDATVRKTTSGFEVYGRIE